MLDFPNSPTTGQNFTGPNGLVWQWDGAKWINGSLAGNVYAPVRDPVFVGNPQAPNPPPGDADTSVATTSFVAAALPVASSTTPPMNGTAAVGVGTTWARADHVHPSDTSRAPLASPPLTGTPTAPTVAATAAAGTTQLATTAFVRNGTTTNDNALAGQVGEFISSQVLLGGAVPLTTLVTVNVTSINLTAGDWDVWGVVGFSPGASTAIVGIQGGVSLTSASIPGVSTSSAFTLLTLPFTTGITQTVSVGQTRVSIAVTTTVYLVAMSTFSGGTLGAYGAVNARRAR